MTLPLIHPTLQKTKTLMKALICFLLLTSSVIAAPERIVSVNGALTETIYALDAQSRLVGVDTTSTYPEAAEELPKVGYQRALSLEGIASLNPEIVLTTQSAGPPLVLDQLQNLGIKRINMPDDYSAEGGLQRIRQLAELLDAKPQGEQLIQKIQADLDILQQHKQQLAQHEPVKVLFLLAHVGSNRMASGTGTIADAMIRLAGGHNVVQDYSGYKPLTAEALAVLNPDVIIAVGGQDNLLETLGDDPALQATTAMQQQRVRVFDSLYFLGFGPRFAAAASELAEFLLTAR